MTQENSKYYEYAFLSAFTNIPGFEDPKEFFKEIENIFSNYRQSLSKFSKLANNKNKNAPSVLVYKPIPYCLFGDFDLAIFSLIDDFSFGSKKFKPSARKHFKYQVNNGIIPKIDIYNTKNSKMGVFENDITGFFSRTVFYPFTGITSVKLNNSMLVGVGQQFVDLVNFYLVLIIDKYIDQNKQQNPAFKMFYIINENLGWNELTIFFFSNSISAINEISLLLRKTNLSKMLEEIQSLNNSYSTNQKKDKINSILKSIKTDSLLAHLISKSKRKGLDFLESHPLVTISTVFGYHIDNLNGSDANNRHGIHDRLYSQECSKEIVAISWNIKPGHEENANQTILKALPLSVKDRLPKPFSIYRNTQGGKFAFQFPDFNISLNEYFALIKTAILKFQNDIVSDVIKVKSKIKLENVITYDAYDNIKHYNYELDFYKIKQKDFEKIIDRLRIYPVPHTIKSQVENLILNYNDAITDPLMYSYFIGLKSPLLRFLDEHLSYKEDIKEKKSANSPKNDSIENLFAYENIPRKYSLNKIKESDSINVNEFINFIETWNKAYWNRHFHGYYFTEINDFNIEHHGGIQQILFCYDMVYKIVSKRIYGDFSTDPFINVRIQSSITSTNYYTTINFTHLFKPAIYACECVHEAANYVIPFLVKGCDNLKYSFLLNPKDITEEKIKEKINRFEQTIKQSLGSKDAFEVQFIEDYFGLNSIRYLFTDFLSYKLAYDFIKDPVKKSKRVKAENEKECLLIYYHTHWFLFLTRAELYVMDKKSGNWYFNENDFKFLFIRCNLMFYLICNISVSELHDLNKNCPSVELNVLWSSNKKPLLDFVIRLGNAISNEFGKMSDQLDTVSLSEFKMLIETHVLKKHLDNPMEREFYEKIISLNADLIKTFHDNLKFNDTGNYYNSIIRKSVNIKISKNSKSNIAFYQNHGREIFLDPKGNLFSTTENIRKAILKKNIEYLKGIWDIAMQASKIIYTKD